MLLDDLAQYLADAGLTADGTEIIASLMPDEPDGLIVLYETGSTVPNSRLTDLNRSIQVRIRGTDYAPTHQKAWSVYASLERPGNRMIQVNNRDMLIRAQQAPFLLERDESQRPVFVFNLRIITGRD